MRESEQPVAIFSTVFWSKLCNLAFSEDITVEMIVITRLKLILAIVIAGIGYLLVVIAQLDWAIQKKELDYPVKSLRLRERILTG